MRFSNLTALTFAFALALGIGLVNAKPDKAEPKKTDTPSTFKPIDVTAELTKDDGNDCLVWEAFAQFGVGVGAKGTVSGSTVKITESFALPAACQ